MNRHEIIKLLLQMDVVRSYEKAIVYLTKSHRELSELVGINEEVVFRKCRNAYENLTLGGVS